MLATELTPLIGNIVESKPGTAADRAKSLRASGLLSRGKQGPYGGAHMTDTDAVNLLLANLLDHARGESVAANVARVRRLPTDDGPALEIPSGLTHGLECFLATQAGPALDALLADIRSGRFAAWIAGDSYELRVTIDSGGGSVFISLVKPERRERAIYGFASAERRKRKQLIQRSITIDGNAFVQIATQMGEARS